MSAFKAGEGPEGPVRRTEDRNEERVLCRELGVWLARTEEGAAAVGATAVDVVTLDVRRKLC